MTVERRVLVRRVIDDFTKCPHYDKHELTNEQIELIVKKTLEAGKQELVSSVGTFVITKASYVVGVIILGLLVFLSRYNLIDWPKK